MVRQFDTVWLKEAVTTEDTTGKMVYVPAETPAAVIDVYNNPPGYELDIELDNGSDDDADHSFIMMAVPPDAVWEKKPL